MSQETLPLDIINGAAALIAFSSWFGFLPPVASVLAIVWYVIEIFESDTIQRWLHPSDKEDDHVPPE